jgi:outer membrane protein TolC
MRFCLWLGLLLPLCSAGCLVGPDFSSPSAPVAERWLEADNTSVDTRSQEYRDWWTVFHDPVLNRLIETAYNQNLSLVSAGTQVLEARAQLGVAIGEFYPQVQQGSGELTYIRPSHADTTRFPIGVTRNFWRDALGLTVNWELDFWGKFRRAIESADASYLASIANYDYVLATLLGDVATTYIGIRTLQTQIAIARDNIVKQKKALAIAEAKYHGGTATKLDVYQAENVLAQTESTIPQLTIQLNQGFNALAVLLGRWSRYSPDPAGSRSRQRPSPSAFRPTLCAGGPISVPPSWPQWRRARKSASPRRTSIPRSA